MKIKFLAKIMYIGIFINLVSNAHAADKKQTFLITPAMAIADTKEKLQGDVKFFFGKQVYPNVIKKINTNSTTRKSNSFAKDDSASCNKAFLSALISLEKYAKKVGANAVVNIVSNNKDEEFSSENEFECRSGFLMSSVTLKGDFVKVNEK
ncbi:MAG: excinuclease ATPase subunit [Pseudomonadota bacterium]